MIPLKIAGHIPMAQAAMPHLKTAAIIIAGRRRRRDFHERGRDSRA